MSETATAEGITVDPDEIAKFSAMAAEWWDPTGKFAPLHKFNPVRLTFLRDEICAHFARDPKSRTPFEGLKVLDIGCGGGLLSEPVARMGAEVLGVDASAANVKTATVHAEETGTPVRYRHGTAEEVLAEGQSFDVVLNMEVVEHVADVPAFLRASADLMAPGGMMVIATLNRTARAFALAVVGAEYVLRWLPRGTHDARKFVKPGEIRDALDGSGVNVEPPIGVSYNPLADEWRRSRDPGVNYMMVARKAG
jgi:2-polyprenyl-6-hydroxyphenyl methylase/3-demethylubiquinone-9 3-methyltransferase